MGRRVCWRSLRSKSRTGILGGGRESNGQDGVDGGTAHDVLLRVLRTSRPFRLLSFDAFSCLLPYILAGMRPLSLSPDWYLQLGCRHAPEKVDNVLKLKKRFEERSRDLGPAGAEAELNAQLRGVRPGWLSPCPSPRGCKDLAPAHPGRSDLIATNSWVRGQSSEDLPARLRRTAPTSARVTPRRQRFSPAMMRRYVPSTHRFIRRGGAGGAIKVAAGDETAEGYGPVQGHAAARRAQVVASVL